MFVRCCQIGALCHLVDEIHKDYNRTIEGDGKKVHRRHTLLIEMIVHGRGINCMKHIVVRSTGFSSSFEIICHMEFTIIQHFVTFEICHVAKICPTFRMLAPAFPLLHACVRAFSTGRPASLFRLST